MCFSHASKAIRIFNKKAHLSEQILNNGLTKSWEILKY